MPTTQIQSLADLSKKSPESVEKIWNDVTEALKKKDSDYKRYSLEKNDNLKAQFLGKFNQKVLDQVKQRLGIKKDVQIQEGLGPVKNGKNRPITKFKGSWADEEEQRKKKDNKRLKAEEVSTSISTGTMGGTTDGKEDKESYVYKPKFLTFRRKKKKDVKEEFDIDCYFDKYFVEYLKEQKDN